MNTEYYTKNGELTKYALCLGYKEVTTTNDGDYVQLIKIPNTHSLYEVYNYCTCDFYVCKSLVRARKKYKEECKGLGIKPIFGKDCF